MCIQDEENEWRINNAASSPDGGRSRKRPNRNTADDARVYFFEHAESRFSCGELKRDEKSKIIVHELCFLQILVGRIAGSRDDSRIEKAIHLRRSVKLELKTEEAAKRLIRVGDKIANAVSRP